MGKAFGIFIVWVAILGGGAFAYKYFILDKEAETKDADKDKPADKKTDKDESVAPAGSLKVKLALDSFSGYCVFRSPEFKKRLAARKIDFECVDDKADYAKRMQSVESGETPLAVFTIDALITHTPKNVDPPAAIVMLIDETRGADAMIAYKQGVKDVGALNDPRAKIVLTEGSPSETLFRVVRNQFNLTMLPGKKQDYILPANPDKGAEDVYQQFLNSRPTERKAFVLWEPYVSLALNAKKGEAQVLMDSSEFKGYIVDVLIAQQKYLNEHPDVVEAVVRTYLEVLHDQQKSRNGMAEMVLADAKIIGEANIDTLEKAQRVARGIWWKNTVENYDHFRVHDTPSKNLQQVIDMIDRITRVLNETREPDEPTVTVGRTDKLFTASVLTKLRDLRPPLHLADQTIREEEQVAALSAADWDRLQPVGNLRVKKIEFSSKNKDQLTDDAEALLTELAGELRQWPQYYLRIEGHTDAAGDREANMALAGRRAETVRTFLREQGIAEHRIKAVAMPPGQGKEVRLVALKK